MSTTPPIQSSGPTIDIEVPWEIRRHLQLIYQKLGNHTQAFGLLQRNVNDVKKAASTASASSSTSSSSSSSSSSSTVPLSSTLGVVNDQTSAASYTTQQGDNGALIFVNDAAVSLASQVVPWFSWIANQGASTAVLTPASGTINFPGTSGATSMSLSAGFAAVVSFDGTDWWAIPFDVAGGGGGTGVSSVNAQTGAVSLVAGANITITPGTPAAGDITIAATGGGGGSYLKGSASIPVNTSPDNQFFTATGITIAGATVGMGVAVLPGSTGFAANLPILSGVVTGTNTVGVSAYYTQGIQSATGGFSVVNCPVLIIVFP